MSDYNNGSLDEPCLRLPYGFGEEVASVELGDGTGYVRLSDYEELKAENAKLRDAMYTNAGKHALQHMDEDELRIWATQQSEYIEELKELARDMWRFTGTACKKYPRLFDPSAQGGQMVQLNCIDSFEQRMRKLGVETDV